MPIFEFNCHKCGSTHELLLSFVHSTEPQACPICLEAMTKETPIPAAGKVVGGTPNFHPFNKRK